LHPLRHSAIYKRKILRRLRKGFVAQPLLAVQVVPIKNKP
jgi:hypothetical protein